VIRSVQIVEPFCKVNVGVFTLFIPLPSTFPGLVGLIFSRDESPVVAADLFKIEQREQRENVVIEDTSEPLSVDDGTAFLFQTLNDFYVIVVVPVEVVRNNVRIVKSVLLHRWQRCTWVAAHAENSRS